MNTQNNFASISEDVQLQYVNYRKKGFSRNDAIALIRKAYTCELHDEEDKIAVLAGLVLALCQKKELFETIADETRAEIGHIKRYYSKNNITCTYIERIEEALKDIAVYGGEASYAQASVYKPNWMVGDTFSHILTHPLAEKLGITGWSILFYKVGEYIDNQEGHRQLMLVSLCPPGDIPSSYEELQRAGFLPMMQLGERLEYLAQIVIKSKREEKSYDLTKVGCYIPSGEPLMDHYNGENPLVTTPLFGRLKRNDVRPAYEDQICRLYRKFKQKEYK